MAPGSPPAENAGPPEPELWRPLALPGPFTSHIGEIFIRTEALPEGELIRFGFRVQPHQCNWRGTCHGGMLASFLDIALARGLMETEGFLGTSPTINMTLDFLAAAHVGEWVEARVTVLHRTRQLAFVEATLSTDTGAVLRGSGTYKRPRRVEESSIPR